MLQQTFNAILIALVAASVQLGSVSAFGLDPDKDPELVMTLDTATSLAAQKKPTEALEKCDTILGRFESHYAGVSETVYCARTPTETLLYLTKRAEEQKSAIAISMTWADTYYLKAYVLQELGRRDEAKAALKKALELSPRNAAYLSEMGHMYQVEKNWVESSNQFKAALDNANFSPENIRTAEIGRARRGLAYDLVELGDLAGAEKLYLECLADDPDDRRAQQELVYVRSQQANATPKE
jgi:tetratricopeptide (TPR) repeat protein